MVPKEMIKKAEFVVRVQQVEIAVKLKRFFSYFNY